MATSTKIHTLNLAKLQAFLFGLIGLALGIYYSIGGLIIDILVSTEILSTITMKTPGLSWGTLFALAALIVMPIIFASVGFILGIVEGLLFNLLAKHIGGINTDLEL